MAITIERKPPERGTLGVDAAPAGQCCCCCCCCLHSVGSVIGALSARSKPMVEEVPISSTERSTLVPKTSATGLYWASVSITCGLMLAYFGGIEHEHIKSDELALLIAIFLPGVQLGASVIAALIIGFSNRVGKEARMAHLGRITLRAFLGGLIGFAIMIPLFLR